MGWLASKRRWAVVAAVAVLALVVAGVLVWPSFQSYTGAAPSTQFDDPVHLDPALSASYPRVLGIAHNAGNNAKTSAAALRNGADVIEIDVISARGRLVAGREQSWNWLASRLFRGPSLSHAWDDAAAAPTVKLDLKDSDHRFLRELVGFLSSRLVALGDDLQSGR